MVKTKQQRRTFRRKYRPIPDFYFTVEPREVLSYMNNVACNIIGFQSQEHNYDLFIYLILLTLLRFFVIIPMAILFII